MTRNRTILWVALLLFFVSCKKEEQIGLEVIPKSDVLATAFSDTITIHSKTLRESPVKSDELSRMLLGSISDPVFGLSNASIYTQVLLGNTPRLRSDTNNVLTADSLVLSLYITGYYGDTITPLSIHVLELDEDMSLDSSYVSNKIFRTKPTELTGKMNWMPRPNDSVTVGTGRQPAQLRINLSKSLAQRFAEQDGQSSFTDNTNWINYFKGLLIRVEPVLGIDQGSIVYFDPNSAYSRLTLYYSENAESKSYDFTLSGAARVNYFLHSGRQSDVSLQIQNHTYRDSVNFLQSMSGTKVQLEFPFLKNFLDSGNVLINKAELIITVPSNTLSKYPAPTDIILTARDSAGNVRFLPDYFENGIGFGGTFDVTSRSYKFNMTRYVQHVLNGIITDYGYTLNVLGSGVQASRVIIGSGNPGASKMKLNVYYTKLP